MVTITKTLGHMWSHVLYDSVIDDLYKHVTYNEGNVYTIELPVLFNDGCEFTLVKFIDYADKLTECMLTLINLNNVHTTENITLCDTLVDDLTVINEMDVISKTPTHFTLGVSELSELFDIGTQYINIPLHISDAHKKMLAFEKLYETLLNKGFGEEVELSVKGAIDTQLHIRMRLSSIMDHHREVIDSLITGLRFIVPEEEKSYGIIHRESVR